MSGRGPGGRPRATVVVATCDRPDLLPECVRSIAPTLLPGDELLVVEAGDSGAAAAVAGLAGRGAHLQVAEPGKSRQLNVALDRAGGEVVVFTDDDCRVPPGWLDAMVAPFAGRPQVGIAFGPVEGLTQVPGGSPPALAPPGDAPFETWAYAHGASFAVRRAALASVGGFDERLGPGAPAHGEEHDALLRLREAGWRAVIADAPAVTHLEWRDPHQARANALVYERGSGAFIGAALRRSRGAGRRLLKHRLGYQLELLRRPGAAGRSFGVRALAAFAGGLLYGFRLPPWKGR